MTTRIVTTAVMLVAVAGVAFGATEPKKADKKVDKKAKAIIAKKCTGCHGEDQITAAVKSGKDMNAIQLDMQKKGAKLSGDEQEVLGIYWKGKKSRL